MTSERDRERGGGETSPRCSPGSTLVVLLPVCSDSSGLVAPVTKASLHAAPQVPANRGPVKSLPRDGVQPMSDTHNCSLPGGKVHSQSSDASIFNLFCWEKYQSGHFCNSASVIILTRSACATLNKNHSRLQHNCAVFMSEMCTCSRARRHVHIRMFSFA